MNFTCFHTTSFLSPYHGNMRWRYLIALGSNLGNRLQHLAQGLQALKHIGMLLQISRILETKPLASDTYLYTQAHPPYMNAVCDFLCHLPPKELYYFLIHTEDQIGHNRQGKWLPRKLDLDILFAQHNQKPTFSQGDHIYIQENYFSVPHRSFWERNFLVELITQDLGISKHTLLNAYAISFIKRSQACLQAS